MEPTLEERAFLSSPLCGSAICCSACSHYCFTIRIIFGNARKLQEYVLDPYVHQRAEEPEGRAKELGGRGLRTVGVFIFPLVAILQTAMVGRRITAASDWV